MYSLLAWRARSLPSSSSPSTAAVSDEWLTQLRQAHLDGVYAYARRRLPSVEDAEDVAAETFAAVCVAPQRVPQDETKVRAWLLGIARNKLTDLLRKRYKRRELPLTDLEPLALAGPEALLGPPQAQALRSAIDGLPADQREALLLKYADELTLTEVGRVLGKSEAAVSSLLQRARATVRERAAYAFTTEEKS